MERARARLRMVALAGVLGACNAPGVPPGPVDASVGPADAAAPDLAGLDGAQPQAGFSVRIAPGPHQLRYRYDELVADVDKAGPGSFTIALATDEVARYRVEQQPSTRVEIVPTAAAADRIRNDPGYQLELRGAWFEVLLDGKRQYVALGWDRAGAAAIDAPVVHVETVKGQLVLRVGEVQGAWVGLVDSANRRVDAPALREHFQGRGLLEVVASLLP